MTRQRLTISLTIVVGFVALVCLAWAIDSALGANTVARNVSVHGVDLSGMTSEEVRGVATDFTTTLAQDPVTISVENTTVATDLVRLGARVDHKALVGAAFEARTDGSLLGGPFRWLTSFRTPVELDLPYLVEADTVQAAVESFISPQLDGPQQPSVAMRQTRFVTEPGVEGVVVDPAQLLDRIVGATGTPGPHRFSLTPYPQRPELSLDSVGRVAVELNKATGDPLEVTVLDQKTLLEPADLRDLIEVDNTDDGVFWHVDQNRAVELLGDRFERLGDESQQARFIVVQDRPEIVPADETVICCDDKTAALLRAALLSRPAAPTTDDENADTEAPEAIRSVELIPIVTDGDKGVAELEELGIVELVSTFTTSHPCCANRVVNIQLFADTIRGAIIEPGETLSLNGYVGQRTKEKGYLQAGAISRGNLEPQYGGGVSQVATTTFNTAFFAGLDIVEYQAHSLYFSRYPEGREATISYPRPDLKIANNTPYGVLLWTEYTPTSITVSMYSTKNVEVEDLGVSRRAQNKCRRVTTTRQRTFSDGTVTTDTFFAVYRPGEGLDCNGDPTVPPETDGEDPVPAEPPEQQPPTTEPPAAEPPTPEPRPERTRTPRSRTDAGGTSTATTGRSPAPGSSRWGIRPCSRGTTG